MLGGMLGAHRIRVGGKGGQRKLQCRLRAGVDGAWVTGKEREAHLASSECVEAAMPGMGFRIFLDEEEALTFENFGESWLESDEKGVGDCWGGKVGPR